VRSYARPPAAAGPVGPAPEATLEHVQVAGDGGIAQLERMPRPARASAVSATGDVPGVPVLWHLKVSNYNEKARWALDFKQVPHVRRAALPGRHRAIARHLTGGSTLPVLIVDGQAIGDSTHIIEALERRYPEPPLYPADSTQRNRALELEEFFDEQLGPYIRLLFLHHALPDAKLLLGAFVPDLRGGTSALARLAFPAIRWGIKAEFQLKPDTVAHAYEKLAEAGTRFRAELQSSGYLVGRAFSVADLTLAALIAPAVAPPQFPYPQPQRGHHLLIQLREALAREGLLYWAVDMYARHRGESAEITA
jgi:glutathione S-transferase